MSKMPKIKNISLIEKLDETNETLEKKEKHETFEKKETTEDIRKGAIDLFLPLEKRLNYLSSYYQLEKEAIGELISCIIGMYFFSKTKNLTEYLNAICTHVSIPIHYRIDCAKNLDNGYHHLNKMFIEEEKEIKQLPTPVRVDTVMFLMNSSNYENETREYFCTILADHTIDELYRFRAIQSLENKFTDKKTFIFYSKESALRFMKNTKNTFSFRVLACQYLLEKCDPDDELIKMIETFLLEVADNPLINDDIRADACDVLLQYGGDSARESARALLFILGGGDIARNNIFKNAQNVHIRSIAESVEKIIEKLAIYTPRNGGKMYDFSKTRDEIIKKLENVKENKEDVEGALTRILIDRAVYGKTNMTLSTILSKVWTYIQDSEYREELEKRLLEELIESNNKCSTGYVSRLVNTLSGFDDSMSITVSFEDQIIANLEGRLNAKIKEIQDEDKMDLILHEMTIPVLFYHLRGNFLAFFRENISFIREEMYQEFCKFMTDTDYDMNFRKAIMHYEGVY